MLLYFQMLNVDYLINIDYFLHNSRLISYKFIIIELIILKIYFTNEL